MRAVGCTVRGIVEASTHLHCRLHTINHVSEHVIFFVNFSDISERLRVTFGKPISSKAISCIHSRFLGGSPEGELQKGGGLKT